MVEFRLLGPLQVVAHDRLVEVRRAKLRALLAILLLEANEFVGPERLADLLWDGRPPGGAQATLHSHVSALRKALEPAAGVGGHQRLVTGPGGYALRVGPDELDVDRFEAGAAEGRRALAAGRWRPARVALERALGLWRGPALGDLADRGFAQATAARLEESRRAAWEDLVEARLALGHHGELVGELEALVAAEPYRERLWAQLMLALYRSARQADALAAYHRLRTRLSGELGLEPGPALQRLEEAILLQKSELDWTPPGAFQATPAPALSPARSRIAHLPRPLSAFVGRVDALDEVGALLATERLVTLTGPGGVGKTRLAAAAADRAQAAFPDGGAFVALAGVGDPDLVLVTVARALAVPEEASRPPVEQLGRHLAQRRFLLVLDNLEHLLPAAGDLAQLLAACPDLTVLATSRTPLGLAGERRYPVPALELPDRRDWADAHMLSANEAVALFSDRARAVRPDFALTDRNAAAVAELCARLDGLPLAIELAAARSNVLTPRALLARLEPGLSLLTRGPGDQPARHHTLRAAFDWSHDLLDPATQRLFRRLGVFVDGADLHAVEAVCAEGDAGTALLDALGALIDASLVLRDPGDGEPRFRMLETVRAYALGRLDASGEADACRRRHLRHFLALAEEGKPPPGFTDDRRLTVLEPEAGNLRAALAFGLDRGDVESAGRLAAALYGWWRDSGRLREGRDWVRALLARQLPGRLRAELLTWTGWLAANQADYGRAADRFAEALVRWQAAGAVAGQACCLHGLGQMAYRADDTARSDALLQQALALSRQAGDDMLVIRVLEQLATNAEAGGDHARAGALYEEALAAARHAGSDRHIAYGCASLAMIELAAGNVDRAARLSAEGLVSARRSGSLTVQALALALGGVIALERSDPANAASGYGEALRLCRDAGMTHWALDCVCGLAAAARLQGDRVRAARLFGAAQRLYQAAGLVRERGIERDCYERHRAGLHAETDPGVFDTAWVEGEAMTMEQAVAYALEEAPA
ncbi:MAG TPA: BTAD domain-containing putative transcriptional regulator [Egibacteraceae bacterium]|nr:BTAD domain-containing putative transcriptional regulator [Egibacteraceae bacterium]